MPHQAGYLGAPPRYTHSPYMPHQPLLDIHSQPTYPAYYLREPRYGLPQPPTPPSPLPAVPPSDHRRLERAYLRGHVAGLDRCSENPTLPQGAVQQAPPARHDPVAGVAGGTASAPQAAAPRAADPREEWRPMAPAEAPQWPPESARRRSPSPRRQPPQRRRNGPRNLPAADPLPPGGNRKGTVGPETMIVPAETTVQITACTTAPRSRILSNSRRGLPPAARPPPLKAMTPPPRGEMTAPAVKCPTLPPREGPMGTGTTLTGVDVGPQARIHPGARAMMRPTQGADRKGSLEHLPIPAPHICRRRNPRTNADAGVRRTGSLRPSHLLAPHTGRLLTPSWAPKQRQASWPPARPRHNRPGMGTRTRPKKGVPGRSKPPKVSGVQAMLPPRKSVASPAATPQKGCTHRPAYMTSPGGMVPPPFGGPFYVDGWGGGSSGGLLWGRKSWVPHFPLQRLGGGCVRSGPRCPKDGCAFARAVAGSYPLCTL